MVFCGKGEDESEIEKIQQKKQKTTSPKPTFFIPHSGKDFFMILTSKCYQNSVKIKYQKVLTVKFVILQASAFSPIRRSRLKGFLLAGKAMLMAQPREKFPQLSPLSPRFPGDILEEILKKILLSSPQGSPKVPPRFPRGHP